MSCDGAVATIDAGGTGEIVRLSCCPLPAAQEQELVRRWKQIRRDLFSTVPVPYGSASFSTGNYEYGINGPPMPGSPTISMFGGVIQPPSSGRPNPTNEKIPDTQD